MYKSLSALHAPFDPLDQYVSCSTIIGFQCFHCYYANRKHNFGRTLVFFPLRLHFYIFSRSLSLIAKPLFHTVSNVHSYNKNRTNDVANTNTIPTVFETNYHQASWTGSEQKYLRSSLSTDLFALQVFKSNFNSKFCNRSTRLGGTARQVSKVQAQNTYRIGIYCR